ncbi:MAG: LON peptidase substrate-binding domain-containing protein [Haloechinothrix sp.]
MDPNSPGDARSATLPLFPLHTVLLPGVHLPLHVFEPRYRQLINDVVTGVRPGRQFGVIAIRHALASEVRSVEQLHPVGCTARLREARPSPDGRFDIVTTGGDRFRLHGVDTEPAPYLLGTVEWLPDDPIPAGAERTTLALSTVARAAHQRYCQAAWQHGDWHTPCTDTESALLSYLLAADCMLPFADRQVLLEDTNPLRRLRSVSQLLTREAGFLATLRAVPPAHPELGDLSTPATRN